MKNPISAACFSILFLLVRFWIISAKRVVILDTTTLDKLQWQTHSISEESGWAEETVTDLQGGSNRRAYVVCDVDKPHIDSWVRTPYIKRGEANRIGVEVAFTIRDCKEFPYNARTCKETFSLFAYESELDFASAEMPAWTDTTYRIVDRIAAERGRFSGKENVNVNNETRLVTVSKAGLYFAFRDEGACTSLVALKIFYDVCEETISNFAWFPERPTGADPLQSERVEGRCIQHAQPAATTPVYYCRPDGKWTLMDGACQCEPGYEASGQQECKECPVGTFKASPGLERCQPCPKHSNSTSPASSECECDPSFYRSPKDPKSSECTKPPSKPTNSRVESRDANGVSITWEHPKDLGGRTDLSYRIICSGSQTPRASFGSANGDANCPSQSIQYAPAQSGFNSTKVIITNLVPSTQYTFLIVAENGVSDQVKGHVPYAVVVVETDRMVSFHVEQFRVDAVTEDSVTLSWQAPLIPPPSYETDGASGVDFRIPDNVGGIETRIVSSDSGASSQPQRSPVDYYEIHYFSKGNERNISTVNTRNSSTQVTISNLRPNTEYGFQIRAKTNGIGLGSWSEIRWVKTQSLVSQQGLSAGGSSVVAGVIGSFVVVGLFIVVLLAYWCYRGRNGGKGSQCGGRKQPSDLDVLDYKNDTRSTPDHSAPHSSSKLASPLIPHFMHPYGVKQYVDPLSYEDPNQAVQEFTNEINCEYIHIEEIIGGGEFSDVCRGRLRLMDPHTRILADQIVAIKTLKSGSSEKAKSDFLIEASIMGQFNHPNVISLCGVVTKSEPVMILTEYMSNRSLDNFLKLNDGKLNVSQLLQMLKCIANGMKYLSDIGYVHRDLAARNVLVDAELNCKISDFGLSRITEGLYEQAYTTKGGKIPVRWTAPEAIAFKKFTSHSDVWSFGVVMWEVMSFGERPYWDWTNQEVIQQIDSGYRLPKPMDCPERIHDIMMRCWEFERTLRPSFGKLSQALARYIQQPDLLSSTRSLYPQHSLSLASLTAGVYQPSSGLHVGNSPYIPAHCSSTSGSTAGCGSIYQSSVTDVEQWLRSLGLEHFAPNFLRNGILNLSPALMCINETELASLGITSPWDQRRILEGVQQVQQQKAMATLARRHPGARVAHALNGSYNGSPGGQSCSALPAIPPTSSPLLNGINPNGCTLPRSHGCRNSSLIYHSNQSQHCLQQNANGSTAIVHQSANAKDGFFV